MRLLRPYKLKIHVMFVIQKVDCVRTTSFVCVGLIVLTSPRGLRCGMVSCFVFAVCACVASLYRDVVYEYVGLRR